jgi:hypothetical protein
MTAPSPLADLSTANVRAHVEHITSAIPSRLAGSTNGRRMAEYSRDVLRAAGAAADVHEMPGLVSFPQQAEFRILAPVEIAFEANTLGHSLPTPPEGLSAELIDVRSGAFEEYAGQDATGKITLSELSYHPARHEKQRIAGLMGSVGCVMMNWGHPENTAVPFGSVKPAWGNPTPETLKSEMATLPCVGIARTAGLQLRQRLAQGPVRVRLRANVENCWRPVQITVGEIAAPDGKDFVVVGGHQDSWPGPQATDNAAGNACIMEISRVFAAHRDKLRRGLVCGFWTGHETGTMIGSSWYVDRNWDRLRAHAVAYLQIDQPACAGTTRWSAASNVELRRFHEGVEAQVLGGRSRAWRRAVKNGDSSFFGLGVPMLAAQGGFTEAELKASAMANLGWWHHSLENTMDKLDWTFMDEHLRVYAAYLWELCTAIVLPFEFVGVADQFIERLTQFNEPGATIGIGGALRRAQDFRAAAVRLEQEAATWRARYAAAADTDPAAAELLNTTFKRLSRLLVPLASTAKGTYGHDPYGYTPQGSMIPSLYDVTALGPMGADSEQRWMLETQLVRARNKAADALDDARGVIDTALRLLG